MNDVDVRSAVAAAGATLLGATALTPVFTTGAWLGPVMAVVLTVLAGGLLLRAAGPAVRAALIRRRAPGPAASAAGVALIPAGQLFLLLAVLTALFAPENAIGGLVPTPSSLADLGAVLAEGSAELQEQATPALPLTGLLALTAVFVGLVAVLVDLVTVAGRQATLAGLGLLVLYCVPVATVTGTIGLVALAAPAAGVALLMWTDQRNRLAATGATRRAGVTGGVAALRIGVAALATGLVLGSFVPTLSEGSLATGLGGGAGGATGTSLDPVATMQGQLTLPEPIELLRLDASVDDPGYLRAVAIDEYDNESGWTLSNLRGEESVADDGELAPLPARQSSRPVRADIRVLQHDDRFLPMLFSPQSVQVENGGAEDWRFDPETGTVYGRDVSSAGLAYSVAATEPRPTLPQLTEAGQLSPDDPVQQAFTALPLLDPRVTDVVASVTAGADTPYERVRSILAFLTDRSNGFIYSLSTESGTSGDDLVDFLRLRRGYCEQYAGAMAVMVRAAGIPARVALGYTPGTEQDDGSRLITSDDAHAWVEVYFEDLGWVPFDPTPITRDRAVELPWAPRAGDEERTASQAEVPVPTVPSQPVPAPQQDRAADGAPGGQSGQVDGGLRWAVVGGLGVALLAVGLVLAPAGLRTLQRRRRMAAGTAGALWDELTATALDTGLRLEPAWTPRQVARELRTVLGRSATSGEGADAVLRLALAEETASYGPSAGRQQDHADLCAALATARRALLAVLPRRVRLRVGLWPASLTAGSGSRVAEALARRVPHPLRRGRRTRPV